MTLSEAQLALRQTGIGASEVGAVLGVSPHQSALEVFLRKTGQAPEQVESEQIWLGNRLEAIVGDLYARRLGVEVIPETTLVHPDHPHVIATPDFMVRPLPAEDPARWLLQVKSRGWADPRLWGEPGTDEIPFDTIAQCSQEMAVKSALREREGLSAIERCDVAVFFGIRDVRVYTVRRDLELEAVIVETINRFMNDHVKLGIPPALDGSEAAHQYLARRFPHHTEALPAADETTCELLAEYRELRQQQDALQLRRDIIEASLKLAIGESAGVRAPAGVFTWKQTRGGGTDWKGLCESLCPTPEQLESFQKPGYRRIHWAPAKVVAP